MTDLTAFLLARIAEDEATNDELVRDEVARCRADGMPGTTEDEIRAFWGDQAWWRRRLAECEAKRRIVEVNSGGRRSKSNVLEVQKLAVPNTPVTVRWLDENRQHQIAEVTEAEFVDRFTDPSPPGETLKFLALPYADHPDYLEEWRP